MRSCHADPPGAGCQLSLGDDKGEREKWGNETIFNNIKGQHFT